MFSNGAGIEFTHFKEGSQDPFYNTYSDNLMLNNSPTKLSNNDLTITKTNNSFMTTTTGGLDPAKSVDTNMFISPTAELLLKRKSGTAMYNQSSNSMLNLLSESEISAPQKANATEGGKKTVPSMFLESMFDQDSLAQLREK